LSPDGDSHRSRRPLATAAVAACALFAPLAAAAPAGAEDRSVSIEVGDSHIALGERVEIQGKLSPERADEQVKLRYKAAGGEYGVVDETRTNGEGKYSFQDEPRRSGRYRVLWPGDSDSEDVESPYARIEVDADITADAKRHVRGDDVVVHGDLTPSERDRRVVLQRRKNGDWIKIGGDRTDGNGEYRARWDDRRIGTFRLRAKFGGDDLNGGAKQRVDHRVNVYRSAHASWYGPGFYGNTTACGQTLHRDTVGVAHKELPCGTRVRFYYHGNVEKIPVIDRGPFVAGREWDLTERAKQKLDFPDTDAIWSTK
jgi:hypothetical protein